jgi:hypothetical protein
MIPSNRRRSKPWLPPSGRSSTAGRNGGNRMPDLFDCWKQPRVNAFRDHRIQCRTHHRLRSFPCRSTSHPHEPQVKPPHILCLNVWGPDFELLKGSPHPGQERSLSLALSRATVLMARAAPMRPPRAPPMNAPSIPLLSLVSLPVGVHGGECPVRRALLDPHCTIT